MSLTLYDAIHCMFLTSISQQITTKHKELLRLTRR